MVARVYYFKRLNIKAALKLFPSEEEALEFLEDYDMDEARAKLLIKVGRILEAAEIYTKNGDILKAVEMLGASATHHADHVRPATEYLLTALRQDLTFGELSKSSPIASKLLVLADKLDKSAMTEQQVDEASPS
ncbi:hypothetical protein BDM02DRAFT_3193093 [Thelephora ganbajun]|uniref:Uncharacterized protein n=1 Tax=Thelephora ganbajun TaxID=370292 RepID=A0ACB6YYP9_THEGA|nr:hypothetical protein BDM02DRAFT_3193093 [Thelephora ganbajun]